LERHRKKVNPLIVWR